MGLDTTHDCWHGAYSAFNRWRNELGRVAGYYLAKQGDLGIETVCLNWSTLPPGATEGDWPDTPHDPLLVILAHSDCDGQINARDCAPLADRLEALLPQLAGDGGGHVGLYRDKTAAFIAGLRTAAAAGEDVEFH